MKASRYNFFLTRDDQSYWYNPLSGSYFKLPLSVGKKLHDAIEDGLDINEVSPILFDKLKSKGFLIDDDCNELEIIRKRNKDVIESKHAYLIILPTLNCNYSCWYCIQKHIPSMMSAETIEKVKRHIDYLIDIDHIESLQIEWFGGEPFMYFNKVIVPISEYAIKKCEKANIPFSNGATTNAYFLTEKITEKFKNLHFTSFQITLDGDRRHHDDVKFKKGLDSAFNHTLSNINRLMHENPDVSMLLRINYTHSNISLDIVDQVSNIIETDIRSRVKIFPRKVWQEKSDKSFGNILKPILTNFVEKGFLVEFWSPVTDSVPCYASRRFYKSINFNGNVVKCTANNDIYDSEPKGILNNDGSITWDKQYEESYCRSTFENDKCLSCKMLPCCMGQCPRNAISDPDACTYNNMDTNFEDDVISFIDNTYLLKSKFDNKFDNR